MSHLYTYIVEDIKKQIDCGELVEGEQMLSERELAQKYDVSRSVVREAIHTLRTEGLACVYPGKGTFVTKPGVSMITETIERVMESFGTSIENILEVREELEKSAIQKAAKFATRKDIEELYEMHSKMEKYKTNLQAYIQLDIQFHLAIARSTKNPLFYILLKTFMEMTSHILFNITILLNDRVKHAQKQHLALIKAIESRDDQLAKQLIIEHLQVVHKEIQILQSKSLI